MKKLFSFTIIFLSSLSSANEDKTEDKTISSDILEVAQNITDVIDRDIQDMEQMIEEKRAKRRALEQIIAIQTGHVDQEKIDNRLVQLSEIIFNPYNTTSELTEAIDELLRLLGLNKAMNFIKMYRTEGHTFTEETSLKDRATNILIKINYEENKQDNISCHKGFW